MTSYRSPPLPPDALDLVRRLQSGDRGAVAEALNLADDRRPAQRQAALAVDLSPAAYEAAKKRLRREVRALLAAMELEPSDLFDPRDLRSEGHR